MRLLDLVHSIRQSHGLEHATMHLLSRCNPGVALVGRSGPGGFTIFGALTTSEVERAAAEAIDRLRNGESQLAVHPRCGTNLVVTSVLVGLAAYGATLGRRKSNLERLPLALMASTLAALIAQPLAYRVQELITTSPDVVGLRVSRVSRREYGRVVAHEVRVGRE